MEKQILQVAEFQKAFGVKLPERPKMLALKRAAFRQSLLEEEVKEIDESIKNKDFIGVCDGIIDSMYILIGTAHEYGITDRLVLMFDEVHRSNMTKMDENGKAIFRKDGKVMKSDRFSAPNIKGILDRDFNMYKENETLQEIARIEKQSTELKIRAKIIKGLGFIDKILYYISNKIEARLKKKVEVKFPIHQHGSIIVVVNGKRYVA